MARLRGSPRPGSGRRIPGQLSLFTREMMRKPRPFGTQGGEPLAGKDIELPNCPLLNPRDFELWEDQKKAIVFAVSHRDALIMLPTGSGKTEIEFWLAAEAFQRHAEECQRREEEPKGGKVLLVADTVELCKQHHKGASAAFKLDKDEIVLTIAPNVKRKKDKDSFYSKARLVIGTPEAAMVDIESGHLKMKDFSLVILDEVHHTLGEDDYAKVAREAVQSSVHRVGLSASPAECRSKLIRLLGTLSIRMDDVYIGEKREVPHVVVKVEIEKKRIEALGHLRCLMDRLYEEMMGLAEVEDFQELIDNYSSMTRRYALPSINLLDRGAGIIRRGVAVAKEDRSRPLKNFLEMSSLHAAIFKLVYHYRVLENIGCEEFKARHRILKKDRTKAAQKIRESPEYKACFREISELEDHPKVDKLIEHLKDQEALQELQELVAVDSKEDAKRPLQAFVFVDSKEHAKRLAALLNEKGIPAHELMGSSGKGGMTPKKQSEVIQEFKDGKYRVLVATNVGSEGLNISTVNIVINYSPPISTIQSQQRRGRIRQDSGRAYTFMVADGEEDWRNTIMRIKAKEMDRIMSDFPF